MRKVVSKMTVKTLVIAVIIAFSSFTAIKYVFDKNDVILGALMENLEDHHYSQMKYDDAFSEKAYDLYLKSLDRDKKFLLQEDIDILSKYRREIDNQILEQKQDFFKKSVDLIGRRIQEKKTWASDILSKPMDYTIDEEYEFEPKNLAYAKTQDELKKQWERMLKYQVLARIDEAMDKQEKAKEKKDTAYVQRSFDSIEVDARRKTLKSYNDIFKFYNKITPKDRFAQYANAITGVYDPHTEYYAPKEKKKFDEMMSGQFEGIGARLAQKDGVLKVDQVIPGSPSSKTDLKAGDEIMKVGQGSAEPVDIANMDMEDAIMLIKGKKGTEVKLTVKRSDNSTKVISIIRDIIPLEDTFAKSAVLENNKNKIGYIYLPGFYTPFTRLETAHHSAQDVRKEIEKLKAQGVKSIILDLRNNGGGSLSEVIDMAGLFFTKGPVVQVKSRNNTINVWDDRNPDVAWDGPLAVLVNHNSASASEILAAAIQDYKRGVIIGTPSFGKGTVQTFYDLDSRLIPQFDTIKPTGQVKITHQKYYRINGGATQLKGVTPDILLPDPYSLIEVGEKELDNPMPWDEISKAPYTEFSSINYASLAKNSQNRVKKNPQFALLEQQAAEIKAKKDDTKYNLKMEKFREEQKQLRAQSKKYEDLRKDIKGFSAYLMEQDRARHAAVDTATVGREDRWAKGLAKDIYIHEAANVLNEMK